MTPANPVVDQLGYQPFDVDNHFYEAPDAFTRHVPKDMQARCVQWAEVEGRKYHVVGGNQQITDRLIETMSLNVKTDLIQD